MKICMIGVFPEKLGEVKGGVANVILYLAQSLAAKGHELHIISAGAKDKTVSDWPEFTVHFVKIPRFIPRVFANATLIRRAIQRKINSIDPDICHFHGSATYMLGYRRPCVLTLHGVPEIDVRYGGGRYAPMKSFVLSILEGYSRRKVKYFIIINKYLIDVIGSHVMGRTRVIENPIAPNFYLLKSVPKGHIFYAGMISKRKNILGLLQAFKIVHDLESEARLRIAGPVRDHDYMQKCQAYINANKLHNHVDFLGNFNQQQVANELKSATCSILASFQETAPLFIGESMSAGVPVVATNVGGNRYMIEHGKTGYITDVHDHQMMADAVLSLLQDSALTESMGNAAKQAAIERFHIETVVDKTLSVYAQVIDDMS